MAHDSATSDALFNMSRNIIDNMEEPPALNESNAKEILFEHNKSGYRLYTAGAKEAGRGTTPTIAHLSEVGFWQFDEQILAGLFQGISQEDGIRDRSPSRGLGDVYKRQVWGVSLALDLFSAGGSSILSIILRDILKRASLVLSLIHI